MSPRHLLAIALLSAWSAGGCASILGVDSGDYADAAVLMCKCANDEISCASRVESAIADDPPLEQIALNCLADVDDPNVCGAVAACVRDAGSCAEEPQQGCLLDRQMNDVIACCDGLSCQGNKCCADEGTPCAGTRDCCAGTSCGASQQCLPCLDNESVCDRDEQCCSGRCDRNGLLTEPKVCTAE